MAEKKTTPISIDGVEYTLEDMSSEQQAMVNHISDLDRIWESPTVQKMFNRDV